MCTNKFSYHLLNFSKFFQKQFKYIISIQENIFLIETFNQQQIYPLQNQSLQYSNTQNLAPRNAKNKQTFFLPPSDR